MKKIKIILMLILVSITLTGCIESKNTINNRQYDSIENINDFESLLVAVVEKTDQAVIGVSNYSQGTFGLLSLQGVGSGVVYKAIAHFEDGTTKPVEETMAANNVIEYEYYAVTNRHVIEDADAVYAYLGNQDVEVKATLLAADDKVDLAVIKFVHYTYIQPLEFAGSEETKSGDFAIAIGSPSGYDFFGSVTFGVVSHPRRYLADDIDGDGTSEWDAEYVQHDVTINPGNSGGPLINIYGEIIGINTMKFVDSTIDNMGFSIPSPVVTKLISILEAGEVPNRAVLGVNSIQIGGLNGMSPIQRMDNKIPDEITIGLFISEVVPNSVANRGGLMKDDIILKFNNIEMVYSYQIRAELGKIIVGSDTSIPVEIYRDGEIITISLRF